ncbi:MAG TPA: aminotransferase class V-fold PLP-dependent enzyme [Candidatus Binatia bacterium]
MLPVYPLRVPLALPYWSGATYRAALGSFFSGDVVDGPALDELRSSIIRQLGVADALLCGSGSFALETALRACGVGAGDEVVIPTFCCAAVVPPVLSLGAVPVFADIGEELNLTDATVEAALTEKSKAVMVPHLFGNPADMDAIVELARAKNIRVVDDAAQALGATIGSRPVGSFGDAGILSFGGEKVCSGIGGGAAVSKNKGLLDRIHPPPLASHSLKSFLSALFWRRWRRWTFPLEPLFSRRPAPGAPPAPYKSEAMANLGAAVASSLMRTLIENLAARRARVEAYRSFLGDAERLQLIAHRPGSACLAQVIRLAPRSRGDDPAARVVEALGKTGYEVQGSYVPIHLLPIYEGWTRRRLAHAERVWADLVELPCEPGVSLNDVERIAAIVRRIAGA